LLIYGREATRRDPSLSGFVKRSHKLWHRVAAVISQPSKIFAPGLLEGLVCLVSGAGSGLGRETALELSRLGATVVGCGRRIEPLEETKAAVEAIGGSADAVATDIRDEEAVDAMVDGLLERHGRLDLLVNNAGGQFLAPAETITAKGFRTVTELNIQGTWNMTHAAATKAFIPEGGGKVLSVTLSPHNGMPGMVHSGAARAAVENMMRTLSVEWSRFGIKLCAIAPGQFETEVFKTKYPPIVVETVPRTIPLGRLGQPEEMAWLIAYLASPAGDFFSGAVLTIDGARDNWFGSWPPQMQIDEAGEPPAEERR
jgi:citronellol/citronellal dehydrogenase